MSFPARGESQVLHNAVEDPTYNPYCMRCPGLVRMQQVARFYWACTCCHAEHDERANAKELGLT